MTLRPAFFNSASSDKTHLSKTIIIEKEVFIKKLEIGMKLKNGSIIVAAEAILGDDFVTTVFSNQTAKVTPVAEFESRGRNGVGVRITKIAEDSKVTIAKIGPLTNLLAVMATDDDPKKPDPNPVQLLLESSKRDLVGTTTERQILTLGVSRW